MNYQGLGFKTIDYPALSKDIKIFLSVAGGATINVGSFTDIDFTVSKTFTNYTPSGYNYPIKVETMSEVKGTLNRGHVSPELIKEFIKNTGNGYVPCSQPLEYFIEVYICFPGKSVGTSTLYTITGVTWTDIGINGSEGGMYREKLSFEGQYVEEIEI